MLWTDFCVVLSYIPCLTQDGEHTWRKIPRFKSSYRTTAKWETPKTNLYFVFIIWEYIWNLPLRITSNCSAWTEFLFSRNCMGYWERSPFQSNILLHKSLQQFSLTSFISVTFEEETWAIKERLVSELAALLIRQGKLPQKLWTSCYTNSCIPGGLL